MNATFAHKALSLLLTACILLSPFPVTHAASGSSYAVPSLKWTPPRRQSYRIL